MATNYPPPPAPGAPARKKISPLIWVLFGCLGLILVIAVLAIAGGFFIAYKAKQAGIDPELWQKNPGVAIAKMMAATNPDAEVLSVDEQRGIVKIRDKKTGKIVTMNFEDIKQGKISFEGEEGERVSVESSGEGESGSLKIKSEGGQSIVAGGDVKLPSWIPTYPGAANLAGMTSQSAEKGEAGTVNFTTRDTGAAVVQFYKDALSRGGFTVEEEKTPAGPTTLTAQGEQERTVRVHVQSAGSQTTVHVTYGRE